MDIGKAMLEEGGPPTLVIDRASHIPNQLAYLLGDLEILCLVPPHSVQKVLLPDSLILFFPPFLVDVEEVVGVV